MSKWMIASLALLQALNLGCASAQADSENKTNLPMYLLKENQLYQKSNNEKELVYGLFKDQKVQLPNQPHIATITGDLIVTLNRDVSEQVILQDSRLSIKARVAPGIFIVATEQGSDLQQLIETLKVTAGVRHVEPDMILPRYQPMSNY